MGISAINSKISIDLNCDLGEYEDISQGINDAAIMPFISACNIACGGHAGNQQVIKQTIGLAIKHHVNIGAHPSYPDRENFGRKVMRLSVNELKPILVEQIQLVKRIAEQQGVVLSHVKPHGALYNQAAIDLDLALSLAEVIADMGSHLMFYGLAHSAMAEAAKQVGVSFVAEGFVDRAYTKSRTLQPRHEPGAVFDEVGVMLKRVVSMLQTGQVEAVSGECIQLDVDTLCLHGDHQGAVETAKTLYQGLLSAGFEVSAPLKGSPNA